MVSLAFAFAACAREQPARVDSAASVEKTASNAPKPGSLRPTTGAAQPSSSSAGSPGATTSAATCVSEGDWQPCSVERRLTDAGFVPIKKGASPTGVFAVPGTSYLLGAAELHVYLFPSAKARESAIAGIDTVAVAPRGRSVTWPTPPTLIVSNNLAAVLISDNGRLIERVQNAITAGLPGATR